ncbi:hypothetical protein F5I97DRAFT_1927878 [Phlebopus sp. FC_14]|nr:hypothetical protein F5I97DRAFT_1927878 [Phlebopus sp. FC_14]
MLASHSILSFGYVRTRVCPCARLRLFFPHSIGGHSMRTGGATSLAAAGVSPDNIRAAGRWKSTAFERYIRKHPSLLALVPSKFI